jgi:hypothetical protein
VPTIRPLLLTDRVSLDATTAATAIATNRTGGPDT